MPPDGLSDPSAPSTLHGPAQRIPVLRLAAAKNPQWHMNASQSQLRVTPSDDCAFHATELLGMVEGVAEYTVFCRYPRALEDKRF